MATEPGECVEYLGLARSPREPKESRRSVRGCFMHVRSFLSAGRAGRLNPAFGQADNGNMWSRPLRGLAASIAFFGVR